ncbi:MAG: hypothetical protein ACRDF6_02225, partial [bacterium]
VRFHDGESAVDLASVRLVIDGEDVTAKTVVTDAFAAFTPAAPFRPGPVHAQAIIGDRVGNTTRVKWTFTVARGRGLIESVTVSPAATLKPGDSLTVVMMGTPGGSASFTATGRPGSVSMRESPQSPGTYFGSYPIGFKDQGRLIKVSTQLRNGKSTSITPAVAAVPVLGRTPQPTIAPAGALIGSEDGIGHVTVQGSAAPGLRVMALLSARSASSTRRSFWTPIVAGSTSVTATGRWRLSLGPFVSSPRAALFLTVVAIDPVNQRSPPVIVAMAESPSVAREANPPADNEAGVAVGEPAVVQQAVVQQAPAPPPSGSAQRATATGPASCSSDGENGGTGGCGAVQPDQEYTGSSHRSGGASNPVAPAPAPVPAPGEPKPKETKPKEREDREDLADRDEHEDGEKQERRKKGKDDD